MKITISSQKLLKELAIASKLATNKSTVPITENFLFEAKNNEVIVSATDLRSYSRTEIMCQVAESGTICVPARILLDTLKNLQDQPITIETISDFGIVVTTENGKYKLSGEGSSDFPRRPETNETNSQFMKGSDMMRLLNSVKFCVSNDELKQNLMSVHMVGNKEMVSVCGTDAHRLTIDKDFSIKGIEMNSLFSSQLIDLLNLLDMKDDDVSVLSTNDYLHINYKNNLIISRQTDDKYPDVSRIIPISFLGNIQLNKSSLISALKRIDLFSNKTTHTAKLVLKDERLTLTSEDLDFQHEASEVVAIDGSIGSIVIGVNAKMLLNGLSNISHSDISINFNEPNKAIVIKPIVGGDFLYLQMPVMLG